MSSFQSTPIGWYSESFSLEVLPDGGRFLSRERPFLYNIKLCIQSLMSNAQSSQSGSRNKYVFFLHIRNYTTNTRCEHFINTKCTHGGSQTFFCTQFKLLVYVIYISASHCTLVISSSLLMTPFGLEQIDLFPGIADKLYHQW